MEKNKSAQLELFNQGNDSPEGKNTALSSSFLARLRNFEKTLLTIIAIVSVGIISYIRGVESGRLSARVNNTGLSAAVPAAKIIARETRPAAAKLPAAPGNNARGYLIVNQPTQGYYYTIQLASYRGKAYAQREIENLKKRGLSPLVLYKGEYIVICTGNFPSKEAAQAALPEIKKFYAGSQIRRI